MCGANERADEYDRWEAEVHAADGVDAFATESRCEVVRHVVTMTLSLFFRCRTVCAAGRHGAGSRGVSG